jgi:antitoxin CptB
MNETMTMQKRLIYNAWHRGVREADLILGPFAAIYVPEFSPLQLEQFEALLDLPDSDILSWIYKQTPVSPEMDNDVMRMVIAFANKEDRALNPSSVYS